MKYVLSYVNIPNDITEHYDHEFNDMRSVEDFVNHEHPDFTSYQIIVVKETK